MKTTHSRLGTLLIQTEDGDFLATYSIAGLSRLEFPRASRNSVKHIFATKEMVGWHKAATRAVRQIMAGEPATDLPPLDLSAGTEFQRKVWAALRAIPAGKIRTYSEVAASLKKPNAARAVGSACGANPVPLLVPCHRVVAAGGGLGGFSGGLQWKEKLLEREGVLERSCNCC